MNTEDTEELLKPQQQDYEETKMQHYNEDSMRISLNWWQSSMFFVGCLPCIVCVTVCGAACCLGTAICCMGTALLGAVTYCGTCCCCSNCCGGCKTKVTGRKGILRNKNEGQTCSKTSTFSRTTSTHQEEIIHYSKNAPDINSPSTSTTNSEERKPLKGILKNKGGPTSSESTAPQPTSQLENGQENSLNNISNETKPPEGILQKIEEEKGPANSSTAPQLASNTENIQEKFLDITPNEINHLKDKLENDERQTSMADSSTVPELSSNKENSQDRLLDSFQNERKPDKEILSNNGGQSGRSGSPSVLQPNSNMENSQDKLLDSTPLISSYDEGSSFRDSPSTPIANEEATDEALDSTATVNKEDAKGPEESPSQPEMYKKRISKIFNLF